MRRLYLDASPGEVRGVATLDGRPERLLIARDGDEAPRLGGVYAGRVTAMSPALGLARLDIGTAQPASLRLSGAPPLTEGAWVDAEVAAEATGDKPPVLRWRGLGRPGVAGLVTPAPPLDAVLQALAPRVALVTGETAREAADMAQTAALAVRHRLAGGAIVTIEPTRALVAVDVDLGSEAGSKTAAAVGRVNLAALAETARLLRLQGLAGLIAVDLIGFPREGALRAAALAAFAPDGPEVVIGSISRFGVLEMSKPRGAQPLRERLLDSDGRLSLRTLAQAALRDMERQARADPGGLVEARCAPALAAELRPLAQRLGPRFRVREDLGRAPERTDIVSL